MLRKVFLVVAPVLCGALGEELNGRAKIRFHLLQNSVIVVDGQVPFDFILDTRTESSLIDSKLARRLNLNSSDHLTLVSSAGYNNVSRAFIPKLLVGKTTAEHFKTHAAVNWDYHQIKQVMALL
jgi:hypothetical protein